MTFDKGDELSDERRRSRFMVSGVWCVGMSVCLVWLAYVVWLVFGI